MQDDDEVKLREQFYKKNTLTSDRRILPPPVYSTPETMNDTQKRLRGLALAETGFLFDPATGHTYTLNRTGAALLCMLRDGAAVADLPSLMAESHDVTAAAAEADVTAFLKQLQEYRLLG